MTCAGSATSLRPAAAALLLAIMAGLGGCSSPPPKLYTIAPEPGPTHLGAPKVIVVREVSLAPYLQQPPIVRSASSYRLEVMANDWWGEPPAAMLTRVLVEDLNRRLPGSTVLAESGAVVTPADATVEVNVDQLDEGGNGELMMRAQAAIDNRAKSSLAPRNFHIVVPPPTPDVHGEVAAISIAVGRLADTLASMLAGG